MVSQAGEPTLPTSSRSILAILTPIPPQQFYYDPTLYNRVQLEERRASKRRKLNVEARVLTSDEGIRLAAEKETERAAKAQKKDTEI